MDQNLFEKGMARRGVPQALECFRAARQVLEERGLLRERCVPKPENP
jgi:hypothetical protein